MRQREDNEDRGGPWSGIEMKVYKFPLRISFIGGAPVWLSG